MALRDQAVEIQEAKRYVEELLADLPSAVVALGFQLREDSTGDPAIFLYVAMPESSVDGTIWNADVTRQIRTEIFDRMRECLPDRWPYIRFTTPEIWPELSIGVRRAA